MVLVHPLSRRSFLMGSLGLVTALRVRPAGAQSSPEASAGPVSDGSLRDLLGRSAIYEHADVERVTQLFAYADIAGQLEVRGLRPLDAELSDERVREWGDATIGLWTDDLIVQYARVPELWEAVGFGPPDVAQTMVLGQPPATVRIYRGAFAADGIASALAASGYREEATTGGTVWTIGPEAELDLRHPIQGIAITAYNNIAVVNGELVVASPYLEGTAAALRALTGDASTLAENRAVVELVDAAGEDLVSAALLDGRFLSDSAVLRNVGATPEELAATPLPTSEETIAPVSLMLFGITAGSMAEISVGDRAGVRGEHDATVAPSTWITTLRLPSVDDAARAASIIDRRLAEGASLVSRQPYAEMFEGWEVEAVDGGPIVRLRISGERAGRTWIRFIQQMDLGFLFTA